MVSQNHISPGNTPGNAIGLFENYLSSRVRDPNLEALSVAQDWLVYHDQVSWFIGHTQDYQFMKYLPFLSVAFHFLFASPSKTHVKYPNTSYEVQYIIVGMARLIWLGC